MPRHAATIESLPQAFEVVGRRTGDRGEGCRPVGRQALVGIVEAPQDRAEEGTPQAPAFASQSSHRALVGNTD